MGRARDLDSKKTSELSMQVDNREKVAVGEKTVIGRRAGPVKRNSRSDWVWDEAVIPGRRPGQSNRDTWDPSHWPQP